MNLEHDDTNDIGCLEAIEALYSWLDGELHDTASLESHLHHCSSCWSRAEMEKKLAVRIRESAAVDPGQAGPARAPRALQERIRNLLENL